MSTNVMKLKNMKIVNNTLFFPKMDFNNGKNTNVNKMNAIYYQGIYLICVKLLWYDNVSIWYQTSLKTNFHTFVKACPNFCSVFWQPLLGTRTRIFWNEWNKGMFSQRKRVIVFWCPSFELLTLVYRHLETRKGF